MLSNMRLERPLAILDLETTGVDPTNDRIVEISVKKILPDGQQFERTRRLNPGRPIPAEATAIHGITDADVAGEPHFKQVARALLAFLDGCDLCGFNLKKYDLRLLRREFLRAGLDLPLEGRAVIDPMEILYRYQPRSLAAAVRIYLDREHQDGHSAAADVAATEEVLDAMLARHPDLPRSVAELHVIFNDSTQVDVDGWFRRTNGQVRFAKTQYRGQPLDVVARTDPGFLDWMLRLKLFDDARKIVRDALAEARRQSPEAHRPAEASCN